VTSTGNAGFFRKGYFRNVISMRIKVLKAANIKIAVFWDVMLHGFVARL
jgi:hypothetical protein